MDPHWASFSGPCRSPWQWNSSLTWCIPAASWRNGLGIGTSTDGTLSLSAVIHLLLKTMQTDGGDDTAVFCPNKQLHVNFCQLHHEIMDSSGEISLTRLSQNFACLMKKDGKILTVILKVICLTCVAGDVSPPPGPSQVPAVPGRRHLEAQTDQVNPSSNHGNYGWGHTWGIYWFDPLGLCNKPWGLFETPLLPLPAIIALSCTSV